MRELVLKGKAGWLGTISSVQYLSCKTLSNDESNLKDSFATKCLQRQNYEKMYIPLCLFNDY